MWKAWKIVCAATRRLTMFTKKRKKKEKREGHTKIESLHTQHSSISGNNRINDDKLLLKWKEFKTNKKK